MPILAIYQQAIKDYNKVIELNPLDEDAYYYRGIAYSKLGNYQRAIKDFNRAIEGDLVNYDYLLATAYNYRGIAYGKLGNHKRAIEDFKYAARFGLVEAQDYLRKYGIEW